MPEVTNVGPELLNSVAELADGDIKLRLSAPPGGDTTVHSHRCAVGMPPTTGALAYLLDPSGVAALFRHEEPHGPS